MRRKRKETRKGGIKGREKTKRRREKEGRKGEVKGEKGEVGRTGGGVEGSYWVRRGKGRVTGSQGRGR